MKKLIAVLQNWTEHEYEPGWGGSTRPDGCSLHLDKESCDDYVKAVLDRCNTGPSPSGYNLLIEAGSRTVVEVT